MRSTDTTSKQSCGVAQRFLHRRRSANAGRLQSAKLAHDSLKKAEKAGIKRHYRGRHHLQGSEPMTNEIRLDGRIQCSVNQVEDSASWIAECETLNVIVEGKSFEEVCSLADEAICLLFTDLLDDGDLDPFLKGLGWTLKGPIPKVSRAPVRVPWEVVMPWELIAKEMNDGQQRCIA